MPTPMPRPVTILALERLEAAGRGFQLAALRGGVENSPPARIGDVALTEFERVHFEEISELVDGLFGGKRHRQIERGTQPSAFEICRTGYLVVDDAEVLSGVNAAGVGGTHSLRGHAWPWRGGLSVGQLLGGFKQTPVMLPAVVLIGHDLSGGIGGGADLADMRGAIVVPAVLIPAHELQADGLAGSLRKNRGGQRHIVITAVAVGARTFVVLDAHFFGGNSEHAWIVCRAFRRHPAWST